MIEYDIGGLIAAIIALIVAITGVIKLFTSLGNYVRKKAEAGDKAIAQLAELTPKLAVLEERYNALEATNATLSTNLQSLRETTLAKDRTFKQTVIKLTADLGEVKAENTSLKGQVEGMERLYIEESERWKVERRDLNDRIDTQAQQLRDMKAAHEQEVARWETERKELLDALEIATRRYTDAQSKFELAQHEIDLLKSRILLLEKARNDDKTAVDEGPLL